MSRLLFLVAMAAYATTSFAATAAEGVADGSGGFYFSLFQPGGTIYLGTPAVTLPSFLPRHRVFRVTASGATAPGWPAEGVSPAVGPGLAERAITVTDDAGGVIVIWKDRSNLSPRLFAQRLDSAGARQWGPGGVLVVSGAGYLDLESAIPDGAGGVLLGWQDSGLDPNDSESDLRAQRLTSAGALASGWDADGAVICSAPGLQRSLRLASDGARGLIACWYDQRGFNPATYMQRIDSSGVAQWEPDGLEAGIFPSADIAADGASGAFLTSVTGGYVVAQRVSASGSTLWTPGGVALSDIGNLIDPRVSADGAGGAVVHWAEQALFFPPPMPSLKLMRLTGTGASSPGWPAHGVSFGDSLSFGSVHHAMPDGAGGFLVAWTDWRVGSVILSIGDTVRTNLIRPRAMRVTGAGGIATDWPGGGVRVSQDTAQVASGDVAFVLDGAGGAMFGWQDVRGGYFGQHLDGSGAKQWGLTDKRLVAEPDGPTTPVIGSDGAGGALVAWMQHANGPFSAFTRHIDAAGALASARASVDPPRGYLSTLAAPDGAGGTFLMCGSYYPGYRVQRFDAGGRARWDTAAVIGQSSGISFPQGMVSDAAGGVYVCWLDQEYVPTVQRFDPQGHEVWPAVQPFGNDPFVFTRPGGTLVADGRGGVILVQPKPDASGPVQHTHLWVQRVDSSGVAQWGATGTGILTGPSDYEYARAAGDGAGGVLLTWVVAASTSADVQALRVDSAGAVAAGWPATGVSVCGAAGRQLYPDIAGDGVGGCLIGWTDARSGVPQVYAQALSSAGSPRWTADGILLGPGSGAQYLQQLVADGSGGAIASWLDARGASWGLRAQRVSGSDSLLWGAGGVDFGAASAAPTLAARGASVPGDQWAPIMAPDGAGGAVFAWQEMAQPFEYAVRAQRITPGGTLAWPGGVTRTLASLVSAQTSPGLARLEWWSVSHQAARIDRADSPVAWTALASIDPTADGRYIFEDTDVSPGRRYGYRLVFAGASGEQIADEVWLDVPTAYALAFSGAFPNPATEGVTLAFTLGGGMPASLDVFDVAGRRRITRDLAKLGAGSHRLLVARSGALAPGVYLARITEGGTSRNRRFAVTR